MTKEERKQSYKKLDKILKRKKITAYKLSNDLQLSASMFSEWKSGRSMPKTDKLLRIADYLDVPITTFVNIKT